MHEKHAVLIDGRCVTLVRRQGTSIVVVAERGVDVAGEPDELTHVLRFDGELVYVATRSPKTGVVVLCMRDLAIVARFDTSGLPRSMAEVGDLVVFGSSNALDVAHVVCPR